MANMVNLGPTKKTEIYVNGIQNRVNMDSVDNSININGDLTPTHIENLKAAIERDYKKEDKQELLQTVEHMKTACNDASKKNWLIKKLGWVLTRTSEVASISSLVITLLQKTATQT